MLIVSTSVPFHLVDGILILMTLDRVAGFRGGADELTSLPPFPKTSVPFLNWLNASKLLHGKDENGQANAEAKDGKEFAQLQRLALQEYMTKLIRCTVSSRSSRSRKLRRSLTLGASAVGRCLDPVLIESVNSLKYLLYRSSWQMKGYWGSKDICRLLHPTHPERQPLDFTHLP